MENGDDVSYVYYDITFDDTAHLEKPKKIVLRGIGAVEVSVFFRPAFIFIMKPSHHILIYCLSTFLSWVIGTLQLAATPRIEFESPHTLVLYQKVHKKEKEVLVH